MTTRSPARVDKNNRLVFWYVYSRSGGTLLSRLLSTNPSLCQLSEIGTNWGISPSHTLESSSEAIKKQSSQWYNLDICGDDFESTVLSFCEECRNNSFVPVIRNWSHEAFNTISDTSPINSIYTFPKNTPYQILSFALVRNAIDVFLSQKYSLNEFSRKYRLYAESLANSNIKLFKYEELCERPYALISKIYKYLGLTSEINIDDFAMQKTTGDSQLTFTSRGFRKKNLISLPRRRRYPRPDQIESNKDLIIANYLLGYDTIYSDLPRQSVREFYTEKALKLASRFYK